MPTDKLAARGVRARRRDRGGQVIVLAILAIAVLGALVFFVYNLGWQVNRRVTTQNAADATAVSGAVWMARSLNVVAMDNVAQVRLIARVPILDSLPLATKMAAEETSQWERALSEQLARGVPDTPQQYLREGLVSLRNRMAYERDVLNSMNRQLDPVLNGGSFRMEDQTYWYLPDASGSPPHGMIWQAIAALDGFSQAAISSAGLLAQADAVQAGLENDTAAAFLVPVLPVIPAVRTRFDDFLPILRGRLRVDNVGIQTNLTGGAGGLIPDAAYPHRLGTFARLFQWRDYIRVPTGWAYVPGTPPRPGGPLRQTRGGGGNVRIGGRRVGSSAGASYDYGQGGSQGAWVATSWQTLGYYTYGPVTHGLRGLSWDLLGDHDHPGELRDTYYYSYISQLTRSKLQYLYNGSAQVRQIHYPSWIVGYPEAKQQALNPSVRVNRTMFYQVSVQSSVPEDSPAFLSPGTFRTNGDEPMSIWARRWQDPARWSVPQVADYVWKDSYIYETNFDPEIGIEPVDDPNNPGTFVWQKVYVTDWYVFGGIDVGTDVPIGNPFNWSGQDDLPAPILLDTREGDYAYPGDSDWRRLRFTFLGVARRGARSEGWPQKFSNANPIQATVAVAQAHVFNNRSWDLWTQDWQAQLLPVSQWNDWVQQLRLGIADAPFTQTVSPEEVERMYQYLSGLPQEATDQYMKH